MRRWVRTGHEWRAAMADPRVPVLTVAAATSRAPAPPARSVAAPAATALANDGASTRTRTRVGAWRHLPGHVVRQPERRPKPGCTSHHPHGEVRARRKRGEPRTTHPPSRNVPRGSRLNAISGRASSTASPIPRPFARSTGSLPRFPRKLDGRRSQRLSPPRQLAGRPLRQAPKGRRGGKSGLHGNTVPGNARRG